MGFQNYYVEAVSNPSTAELFYKAAIQPLYANAWVTNNTEYSNYWDTRKKDLPEINTVIKVEPLPSRIAGRVIDKSSGKGLENSLVFLYDKKQTAISFCATDNVGYFEFS